MSQKFLWSLGGNVPGAAGINAGGTEEVDAEVRRALVLIGESAVRNDGRFANWTTANASPPIALEGPM